jgi:hypothetical protein
VVNILNSADFRVVKTMSVPPEPCVPPDPCKDLTGKVNKLEAIDHQVSSVADMVGSMIGEVMDTEPLPFHEDLVPSLIVVNNVAQGIVDKIGDYMEIMPDSQAPEFMQALGDVSSSASRLVDTTEYGIEQFSDGPKECADITDEEVCNNTVGCAWDATFYASCVAAGS